MYFLEYPAIELTYPTLYVSRNHDTPTLFAHAPILSANTSLFQQLRQHANDLRNYAINPYTPQPLDPWGVQDGWNDDASSIHVPEGISAKLYQHINYAGNAITFSSWARILTDYYCGCGGPDGMWNDQASSFSYNGVMLFNNIEYNDPNYPYPPPPTNNYASQEFFQNDDDYLPDNYIGNDSVTSLCVGQGWQVVLYENAWYNQYQNGQSLYKGPGCYNLTDDLFPGGGTWNDKASSLHVIPP